MQVLDDKLLCEMVRRLVEEFHPEQVILIGSRAWGHPGPDSDVDLLVIVPESDLPPSRRAQRAHRCLRGMKVSKDVLVRTRSEIDKYRHVFSSLESQAMDQGVVLYG